MLAACRATGDEVRECGVMMWIIAHVQIEVVLQTLHAVSKDSRPDSILLSGADEALYIALDLLTVSGL